MTRPQVGEFEVATGDVKSQQTDRLEKLIEKLKEHDTGTLFDGKAPNGPGGAIDTRVDVKEQKPKDAPKPKEKSKGKGA